MIQVRAVQVTPPARGGGEREVRVDGFSRPYCADPELAVFAFEEVVLRQPLIEDVVTLVLGGYFGVSGGICGARLGRLIFDSRIHDHPDLDTRSEERRVGEEGRSRWSPDH